MLGFVSESPILKKWQVANHLRKKKKNVNGEKLYFMKVILLYLVFEKSWFLEHFRMLEASLFQYICDCPLAKCIM